MGNTWSYPSINARVIFGFAFGVLLGPLSARGLKWVFVIYIISLFIAFYMSKGDDMCIIILIVSIIGWILGRWMAEMAYEPEDDRHYKKREFLKNDKKEFMKRKRACKDKRGEWCSKCLADPFNDLHQE
jgi:hypothetical protein